MERREVGRVLQKAAANYARFGGHFTQMYTEQSNNTGTQNLQKGMQFVKSA
jgi:hypothetical protein